MPEIHAIDEFKNDLIRLGNEPEIRAERGEALPDITVPDAESVDDLSALFSEEDSANAAFDLEDETDLFAEDGLEEDEFDTIPDTDEDFSEDGFDIPEGLTEESEEEEPEQAVFEDEELSDFGDFDTLPQIESEPEQEDEFGLPDGLLEGLDEETEEENFDFDAEETGADAAEFDAEEFDADITDFDAEETDADAADFDTEEFDADITDFDAEETDADITDFDVEDFDADTSDFDTEDFDIDSDRGLEDTGGEQPEEDFSLPEGLTDGLDDDLFSADEAGSAGEAEDFSGEELDVSDFDSEIEEFDSEAVEEDLGDFDSEDLDADEADDFSLEDFSLGEIDGDDIDAAEFSLGDLGQEFGVEESDLGELENVGFTPQDAGGDFGEAYSDEDFAIPDDEFIELKKTLGAMPRNLKLLIEELIGEKQLSGENLDKLIQALITGKSAKDIGSIVSKITGKKVRIPAQYERRTAGEYEKEKASFGYAFRKNFIPMFRAASIAAIVLGLLLFIGYKFIYTPLHAESLYRKGYEEIALGNNQQANFYFSQAFSKWKKKSWFYDYAESFTEQKQYLLAEEKYEQLLGWYPQERDGVLDYAELEFKTLGKYPEAEKLLNDLLFDHLTDYDARLMLGDTYMEWAREIDPSKYEDARFNYAKLLEQYGGRDELLFRMLRYFIRTDNHVEAMNLYEAFKQNTKADIEPEIYAELAGYLIDNGQFENVRDILMKAKSADEELPEIHYQLARYFDIIDIPNEEEKALAAAIWLYENTSPLTRTRKGQLIDSYNRYGKVLYEKELYLDAEDFYQKAASNYDEALSAGQLKPEPKYGTIFSNLGNLSYYISGDYDQALAYFEKSERNGYSPEILKYKKGYIYYSREDYRNALVEFYDTAGGFSVNRALLYSTANTLFNRNDYYLAEGYYTHLLDILNKEYSSITYLLIDEIPEHRALLENLMKVSNNLGVVKYRLYERSRDPEKNAEAMVLLTDSVEFYDTLSRDPVSLVEPKTVNLSYLNSKAIFYPVENFRLQIYQDIPKDLTRISF